MAMSHLVLNEGRIFQILAYDSSLSISQIAESLGISRQYLNRLFDMEKLPQKHRTAAAELLGINEDDFDQVTLREQVESLQKDVRILRAENNFLKAKVTEHEARIKTLEAENIYLKTRYN